MPGLTIDQVRNLAPDPASAKAAQGLASLTHWGSLSRSDTALWGECKGSGQEPYRVCVDMIEIASSCTCPSRKFPCKHALGLLLLNAALPGAFKLSLPPAWAHEWLEKRSARRQAAASPPARVETKPADDLRQKEADRRAAKRAKLANSGMDTLDLWLKDFARMGLAAAQTISPSFWEEQAARMVDAQIPGVARQIREMAEIPGSRSDWAQALLLRLGRLYLLVRAFRQLDALEPGVRQDVQTQLGWTVNQKELLATNEGIQDDWLIISVGFEDDEKTGLRTQTAWLSGRASRQLALILNFAFGAQPLDTGLIPGAVLRGSLVYFPGNYPLRAIFRDRILVPTGFVPAGYPALKDFQDAFADALGKNPWLETFPAVLQNILPVMADHKWLLVDNQRLALPVVPQFGRAWELYALSGGRPLTVFGAWDGFFFSPLAAWVGERCVQL